MNAAIRIGDVVMVAKHDTLRGGQFGNVVGHMETPTGLTLFCVRLRDGMTINLKYRMLERVKS